MMGAMSGAASSETEREVWEALAPSWLGWTDGQGQDPYAWDFNLPSFVDLVPAPRQRTLDVGCGEGRVARMLAERGHHVVGIDGSATLSHAAADRGTAAAQADAAALPIPDESVDIVVSSMVLMDIDDLGSHTRELARVTRPGGAVCVSILHPLQMAGRPLETDPTRLAIDDYLTPRHQHFVSERQEVAITFQFWRRPVSHYVNALTGTGLHLVEMQEPAPSEAFTASHPEAHLWTRVPMFLHLLLTKP